ncbi:MAG TPA: Zn-ribbon domain-containing OB-fold protein [bacterium]|nr:Zn-ribbon domain-containing OB-fold protein [bacterium]
MAGENEVLVSEQVLQVPYKYSAGPVVSRFLIGLRDEKKIYAQKCGHCGKVCLPPRASCTSCRRDMSEWVEVGPEGSLVNFTVVHYSEPMHPATAPYIIGIIRLDGADTGLVHVVRAPEQDLKIGLRVRPVFAKERKGHILDLECFEPAE